MIKNLRLIIPVLLLVVILAVIFVSARSSTSDCTKAYRNDMQVSIGGKVFNTEVAKSRQDVSKGLSGRGCIASNQAMLFVFDQPGKYAFWMKDMNFPIDIIWIGPDKKVVNAIKEVEPSTYREKKSFQNEAGLAQYVLELQSGQANELGLQLGTPVNF